MPHKSKRLQTKSADPNRRRGSTPARVRKSPRIKDRLVVRLGRDGREIDAIDVLSGGESRAEVASHDASTAAYV